jgi:hypothetical protein
MGRWEGDFDFSDFSVPMGLNFVSREIGSHHAPRTTQTTHLARHSWQVASTRNTCLPILL